MTPDRWLKGLYVEAYYIKKRQRVWRCRRGHCLLLLAPTMSNLLESNYTVYLALLLHYSSLESQANGPV